MHTSIHSSRTGIARRSRTRWFTAYFVLAPAIGFLVTVASGGFR